MINKADPHESSYIRYAIVERDADYGKMHDVIVLQTFGQGIFLDQSTQAIDPLTGLPNNVKKITYESMIQAAKHNVAKTELDFFNGSDASDGWRNTVLTNADKDTKTQLQYPEIPTHLQQAKAALEKLTGERVDVVYNIPPSLYGATALDSNGKISTTTAYDSKFAIAALNAPATQPDAVNAFVKVTPVFNFVLQPNADVETLRKISKLLGTNALRVEELDPNLYNLSLNEEAAFNEPGDIVDKLAVHEYKVEEREKSMTNLNTAQILTRTDYGFDPISKYSEVRASYDDPPISYPFLIMY